MFTVEDPSVKFKELKEWCTLCTYMGSSPETIMKISLISIWRDVQKVILQLSTCSLSISLKVSLFKTNH